jgi:biopolymer transport protein ExbB
MKNRFSAFLAAAVLALTAAVAAPVMAQEQASAAAPATSAQASAAAPAASVPAAAPAAEGGAAKEVIENPYGLDALWKTGDFVAKGTLIIMIIMSMGSWYILITKTIDQVKLSGQAGEARSKFWKAASVQAGVSS